VLRKLVLFPTGHLALVVPVALLAGLIVGLAVPVPQVQALMMPAALLMVFPIMIGIPWRSVLTWKPVRLMTISTLINFVITPTLAWLIGRWLLADYPAMMAGLAIASLLPTSGMTISWTVLNGGNAPAAVRITVISLLGGSLLMPLYLVIMVGQRVPLEIPLMLARIAIMVILPMILGTVTYSFLQKRYTPEKFAASVKPYLPAVSIWAMLYVVFMSTASRARYLLADPKAIAIGLLTLVLFYFICFGVSTLLGRWFLGEADSYTLIYSTVLLNLSIALGTSLALFGAQAAFLVTMAFILQVQAAAWYGRVARRFGFFRPTPSWAPQSS
jgi:arsenite transporter